MGSRETLQPHVWDILLSRPQPLLPNLETFRFSRTTLGPPFEQLLLGNARMSSTSEAAGTPRPLAVPAGLTHLSLAMTVSATMLSRFPPEVDFTLEHLVLAGFTASDTLHRPLDHNFLPVLRSLTIYSDAVPSFKLPFPPFPGLRSLMLPSAAYINVVELLRALQSPHLESILIHKSSGKHIYQLIAKRWSSTLTSFDVDCTTLKDLTALAECTELQTFRLTTCRTFPIDDFLVLASRWTVLRTLSIPTASDISLAALTCLARQFPLLIVGELDLTHLIGTLIPPIHETPLLEHNLKQLLLHSFPPEKEVDVRLLACHLDRLFPRLDEIRYVGRTGAPVKIWTGRVAEGLRFDPNVRIWGEVLRVIFEMQDRRRI
ncbi:hypothetical protein FB45DRAFT_1086349 [Roridomyces roridus]|uniref:Uncharacterized protein n=1 Tax=Roridomyces roridus TaxID=1738132 RepID=A0AAD7BLC2_9AGAR|nr:hypothetical protein FB45DRAFT_1086349 [Roridomyces roridus]